MQSLSDLGTGQTGLQGVVPVDRQSPEGKTGIFLQQLPPQRLRPLQRSGLLRLERRGTGGCVRPFESQQLEEALLSQPGQPPAGPPPGRLHRQVMAGDQDGRPLPGGVVQAKAGHSPLGQRYAQAVVAIEMPDAPLIQEKGGGLPHVMKKGGKSESGGGGDQGSRLDAVGIHVPAVVGITLVKAHRRAQLWKNLGHYVGEVQQHLLRSGGAE